MLCNFEIDFICIFYLGKNSGDKPRTFLHSLDTHKGLQENTKPKV